MGFNPEELIEEVKQEHRGRGELAKKALQWFLDEEHIGEFYLRSECIELISQDLGISNRRANIAVSHIVGDIVDPVQQVTLDGEKHIGVIDYKVFSDEGAYGYVDFDDRKYDRKRVVCAKCVEDEEYDENVVHATQGEGTSDQDASWQDLLNKITSHYTRDHTEPPETVQPGASLVDGTTISGNTAWHSGNDGDGSGLNADFIRGNDPSSFSAEPIGLTESEFDSYVDESADTMAASPVTMGAIVSSPHAMDAVADSQTAMDAVIDSQTAMYAVSDSQTAMDAVVNSKTAMNSVVGNKMSKSKLLDSPHILSTLWENVQASEIFWESGTPTPPENYSLGGDEFELSIQETKLTFVGGGGGDDYETIDDYYNFEIDLNEVDGYELLLESKSGELGTYSDMRVYIDGDEVFSENNPHDWTERSLDLSDYSGTITVSFGGNMDGEYGPDNHRWRNVRVKWND